MWRLRIPFKKSIKHSNYSLKTLKKYPKTNFFIGSSLVGLSLILSNPPDFLLGFNHYVKSSFAVFLIVLDYKLSLTFCDEKEKDKILSKIHTRSAERLLKLFLVNKGIFIKVGQHIAALNNIIPPEYTEVMKKCQDHAECDNFSNIKSFIEKELGDKIENVFYDFSEKPIAAASIAQVHLAKLKETDEQVVVKVQYPQLETSLSSDIATLDFLISTIEKIFPEVHLYWLVKEIKLDLPYELDFINEANNSEKLKKHFQKRDDISTPQIYWNYTTRRILTMEFVEGFKLNDHDNLKKHDFNLKNLSKIVSEVFAQQIFIDGWIHCDPHQEIFWQEKRMEKSKLLLSSDFILDYCYLWKGLVLKDKDLIKKYVIKLLGDENDTALFATILTSRIWKEKDIGMNNKLSEQELKELMSYGQSNFIDILKILSKVPQKMILLLKSNELLRSIQMDLGIPVNYYLIFVKYAMKGIYIQDLKMNSSFIKKVKIFLYNLFFEFQFWVYINFLKLFAIIQQ
eukprot:gene2016-1523_t